MPENTPKLLADALWRLHRRPALPTAWEGGGNLPWNEPAFAERMLREHLDESHAAASRRESERTAQLDWLWTELALAPGMHVYDVTCGPGLYAVELAKRGCRVTGVDFSPASIAHARKLAEQEGVAELCTFLEADVREVEVDADSFDAALFLYGQLGVFPKEDAAALVGEIATRLRSGARMCVELLDPARVDREIDNWWYTDNTGLWGDAPFLHLGERFWDEDTQTSTERFHILHLETGEMNEILLCDQTYTDAAARALLTEGGFSSVGVHPAWNDVDLYDAQEWIVYIAVK